MPPTFKISYFYQKDRMTRMLVIGYVWPEPKSSAAGKRMMQLLELFQSHGYDLVFATTASETPFQADLAFRGIQTKKIELNSSSFDHFIEALNPRIVLYDRFMMEEQFGWRVRQVCPKALQILDTEDLHFLRKARQESISKGVDPTKAELQTPMAKREIASIFRSDLSLIISRQEMNILMGQFQVPSILLYYLPIMRPKEVEELDATPDFEERKEFISIGNFLHAPNWDAVLHLKRSIWPLIRRELPTANLLVYGAYPSTKVFQLHNKPEGFLIKGRAESARGVLKQARVLLAPLNFGAGIKGKFLDAMAAGTPSVTTSIGIEGMSSSTNWGGSIQDEPPAFAEAAIRLYSVKSQWATARIRGHHILHQNFPGPEAGLELIKHVELLMEVIENHRTKNFIGQMLQHHQHDSTRYLSKYIEAKNASEN